MKDRIGVAETKLDVGSTMLNGVIQDLHLNDAHTVLGLVDPYFTFFLECGRTKSRIDLCLFSDAFKCANVKHRPVIFSDHVAVYVDLSMGDSIKFGLGVWRLNSLLLQDEHVKAHFSNVYSRWVNRKKDFSNILGWWDWVKRKIKLKKE